MTLNRRELVQGLGFLGLGFLFRGRDRQLVPEPIEAVQPPSAVDITVMPQHAFRPERLVIPATIAPSFLIEEIRIGGESQLAPNEGLSAEVFTPNAMDAAMLMDMAGPGIEIHFRVRYIGDKPEGEMFTAALFGVTEGGRRAVMPISSGCRIIA